MPIMNYKLCIKHKLSSLATHDEGVGDFAVSAIVATHVDGAFGTDFAESGFVFLHVLHEGAEEVLGILGSHDDA